MSSNSLIDVFLQPGEYFVGDKNNRIRTVLGSCVSITLWHPVRHIGAMSHFLLASRGSDQSGELDGRYGEEAMQLMLDELASRKIKPSECQGKIFGGGIMFPRHMGKNTLNVGQKNGEVARALLRRHGIMIVSESLFGVGYRQIIFKIATGNVWVRQIPPEKITNQVQAVFKENE
jgi:chemotaxis protein CheD